MAFLRDPDKHSAKPYGWVDPKKIDEKWAEEFASYIWKDANKLNRKETLPFYLFPKEDKPTLKMLIPNTGILDSNQNYIVGCYSSNRPKITLIGVCQGRKLKSGITAKELSFDVEEPEVFYEPSITLGDTQTMSLDPINSQPAILDGTQSASMLDPQQPIIIPDFFVYKGKPASLPDFVLVSLFYVYS